MKRFLAGYLEDCRGVAAMEFALIAPFLTLLTVGIIDYGMYINERMKVENLARNAVEYVVKGGDEANLMADVIAPSGQFTEDELEEEVDLTAEATCECGDGLTISCSDECSGGAYKRRFFNYTIELNYTPIFPYPGIPETFPLRGHARMQIE